MPRVPDGRSQLGAQEAKQGLRTLPRQDCPSSHRLQETQLGGKHEILTLARLRLFQTCVHWPPRGRGESRLPRQPGSRIAPVNPGGPKSPCVHLPQVNTQKELLTQTYRAARGSPSPRRHQTPRGAQPAVCGPITSTSRGPFSCLPK